MPLTNLTIEKAFTSNLSDTLVDVVPALGTVWIVCTDKIYRYDYSTGDKLLAYTLTPSGTERISCAIGYNGHLYIGTTQPDHALNARIIRLEPSEANITDLTDNDGAFLTGANDLSVSAGSNSIHGFLGLATASGNLLTYYQYDTAPTIALIYRQAAQGSWLGTLTLSNTTPITEMTQRDKRYSVLVSGNAGTAGIVYYASGGEWVYGKLIANGRGFATGGTITTGVNGSAPHICGSTYDRFIGFDEVLFYFYEFEAGWRNTEVLGLANVTRPLVGTQLWYENFGSTNTLPAALSAANFYGGVPFGDLLFIGAKMSDMPKPITM